MTEKLQQRTGLQDPKPVLQYFWDLASEDQELRTKAVDDIQLFIIDIQNIFNTQKLEEHDQLKVEGVETIKEEASHDSLDELLIHKCPKAVIYCLKRLIKGVGSSKDSAKSGYFIAMTYIIKDLQQVESSEIIRGINTELQLQGKKSEDYKQVLLGRIIAFSSLIYSGRIANLVDARTLAELIIKDFRQQSILQEIGLKTLLDLNKYLIQNKIGNLASIGSQQFDEIIQVDIENCQPEILALILDLRETLSQAQIKNCKIFNALNIQSASDRSTFFEKYYSLENQNKVQGIYMETLQSHPRIHKLWYTSLQQLLPYFVPSSHKYDLQKGKNKAIRTYEKEFTIFWNTQVNKGLFVSSSNFKKYLAMNLIKEVTPQLDIKLLSVVLTQDLFSSLSETLQSKENNMFQQAKSLVDLLTYTAKKDDIDQDYLLAFKRIINSNCPQNIKGKDYLQNLKKATVQTISHESSLQWCEQILNQFSQVYQQEKSSNPVQGRNTRSNDTALFKENEQDTKKMVIDAQQDESNDEQNDESNKSSLSNNLLNQLSKCLNKNLNSAEIKKLAFEFLACVSFLHVGTKTLEKFRKKAQYQYLKYFCNVDEVTRLAAVSRFIQMVYEGKLEALEPKDISFKDQQVRKLYIKYDSIEKAITYLTKTVGSSNSIEWVTELDENTQEIQKQQIQQFEKLQKTIQEYQKEQDEPKIKSGLIQCLCWSILIGLNYLYFLADPSKADLDQIALTENIVFNDLHLERIGDQDLKKIQNKNNKGSFKWQDQIIDLVLSIQSKDLSPISSAPIKDVSEKLFEAYADHLRPQGCKDFIRLVRQNPNELENNIVEDDDEDDDEELDLDQDDDDQNDQDEEDEKIVASDGNKIVDSIGNGVAVEEESSDVDMDDDQMMQFDKKLASYVKLQLDKTKDQKARVQFMQALQQRALSLVQLYIKSVSLNSLSSRFFLFWPLLSQLFTEVKRAQESHIKKRLENTVQQLVNKVQNIKMGHMDSELDTQDIEIALKKLTYLSRQSNKEVSPYAMKLNFKLIGLLLQADRKIRSSVKSLTDKALAQIIKVVIRSGTYQQMHTLQNTLHMSNTELHNSFFKQLLKQSDSLCKKVELQGNSKEIENIKEYNLLLVMELQVHTIKYIKNKDKGLDLIAEIFNKHNKQIYKFIQITSTFKYKKTTWQSQAKKLSLQYLDLLWSAYRDSKGKIGQQFVELQKSIQEIILTVDENQEQVVKVKVEEEQMPLKKPKKKQKVDNVKLELEDKAIKNENATFEMQVKKKKNKKQKHKKPLQGQQENGSTITVNNQQIDQFPKFNQIQDLGVKNQKKIHRKRPKQLDQKNEKASKLQKV